MRLLIFNLKTDADDDVLGFTTDWINSLAVRCNQVFVITMCAGRLAVHDNVRVYSVGKEQGYSEIRRVVEFYRLLSSLLKTEKIDSCFAHMMPLFVVMGWPLLRAYQIPIVMWYAHKHVSMMLRLATFLSSGVVSSSSSGFQIPTRKLQTIGQGIDVNRFCINREKADLERDFIILTVGRISLIKRLDILIRALPLIREELPDGRKIIARFVGSPLTPYDYIYAKQLKQFAIDLDVEARVQFRPAQPFWDIQTAYQGAHLFVNSSETESIDKTVLEAMSCGLPVITSNTAFADVLGNSSLSTCSIPKNSPVTLAAVLNSYLAMDSSDRDSIGLALCKIVVSDHSLDALASKIIYQLKTENIRKNG